MKIYRIAHDPAFHALSPAVAGSLEGLLPFDSGRRWDAWTSAFGPQGPQLRVKFPERTGTGNFFMLHSGVLVHDWQVADAASERELLQDDMEYLPARLEGASRPLCVMNVMGCYNCLDRDRSEFTTGPNGEIFAVTKHVFHPSRILDSSVFKIPETCQDTVYALSGRQGDDFVAFYEERGYSGLVFEELWSGE